MFYTIYKITNKLNGKYYIGKHQTLNLDDGYMGSGKLITRAIKKYGIDNFTKEILFVFDTEDAMNVKEAELVVVSEETYNLCEGGKGGWSYVNREIWSVEKRLNHNNLISGFKSENKTEDSNKKILEGSKKGGITTSILAKEGKLQYKKGLAPGYYTFKGKSQTIEARMKISQAMREKSRGFIWITDGNSTKKIKNILEIPDGWRKGRK